MEKISIARRHWEKKKFLYPVQTGADISPLPMKANAPDALPYVSDTLGFLLSEKAGLFQPGNRQFTVEITSGLDKPLKMVISVQPQNSHVPGKDFFTIEETARILRVSPKTVCRQLQRGALQGFKIGRRWRVISNSLPVVS